MDNITQLYCETLDQLLKKYEFPIQDKFLKIKILSLTFRPYHNECLIKIETFNEDIHDLVEKWIDNTHPVYDVLRVSEATLEITKYQENSYRVDIVKLLINKEAVENNNDVKCHINNDHLRSFGFIS